MIFSLQSFWLKDSVLDTPRMSRTTKLKTKPNMKNVTISRRILRTDEQTIGKRGSYTYVERLKNNQMGKDSEKKLKTFT